MPYVSPLKTRAGSPVALDSGDFLGCQRMLDAIDYAGFASRQLTRARRPLSRHRARQRRERHRPRPVQIRHRAHRPLRAHFRLHRRDAHGARIKTALAQICAEQFDVAPDSVAVAAGDTAVIPYGQGGFASRQTVTAGSAVHLAAVAVRDKALKVAAHLLEVSVSDLELRDGRIEIAGAPGAG